MVIPVGLGVEVVMIACIHAYAWDDAPLGAHGEQGRSIFVNLCSVLELVHGFHLHGLLKRGVVFHLHLRVEFIFGSKVEGSDLVIHAYHGSDTNACLVAHQVYAERIFLQRSQLFECCISLCLRSSILLLGVNSHLSGKFGLSQLLVDIADGIVQEGVEVDIATLGVYLYVAQTCLVGSVAVECAQTSIYRQVLVDLIGGTQLEAEVILASAHVGIHVVALGAERFQLLGNHAHGTFERSQTFLKLAYATSAGDGEVELNAPVASVIGCLDRGDKGCIGNTFKGLACLAVVFLS